MYISFEKIFKASPMNELIEKYFENTLTKNEEVEFKKLLVEDAEFKTEFEFQKELQKAIQISERQKIKTSIQNFEKTKVIRFNFKQLYPYAAILILAFGVWFIFSSNPSPEDLYADYFEIYPNVEVSNTRGDDPFGTLLDEAFLAYDLEDYNKANSLFSSVLAQEDADYIYFYNAMCLMQLNDHEKALNLLNSTTWSEAYLGKAMWYKALCYLKLNNITAAKQHLQSLINTHEFRQKEAKVLLSEL